MFQTMSKAAIESAKKVEVVGKKSFFQKPWLATIL